MYGVEPTHREHSVKPNVWLSGLVIAMTFAWSAAAAELPPSPGIGPDRSPSIAESEQQNNPPRYPKEAADAKHEGVVVLLLLVGADGVVEQASIDMSSGYPELDAAAIAAGSRWHFNPRVEHGVPMRAYARVPMTFTTNTDQLPAPSRKASG